MKRKSLLANGLLFCSVYALTATVLAKAVVLVSLAVAAEAVRRK